MAEQPPIDTLADAEAFLLERINYERTPTIPYQEHHLKLQRMLDLLDRLGNPHVGMPCVHVAGTKGKGSTCAMLTSMLLANEYRVGTYTSPHFQTVLERLAVNGRACHERDFVELVRRIAPVVRAMDRQPGETNGPTFFEVLTALAFLYFRQQEVQLAVFEVGLGGRLDSTNVCQPIVCAITSISLDHMMQLGHDLASIAREKAGIIKPGIPVVSGVRDDPARFTIAQAAQRTGSRLLVAGADFDALYADDQAAIEYRQTFSREPAARNALGLSLRGAHQVSNAAVALACIDVLRDAGWIMDEQRLCRGLASTASRGRIEVLGDRPAVILDTAHNGASMAALLAVLDHDFAGRRCVFLFGTTRGKDVPGMLVQLLNRPDHLIFTQYRNNPRSHDAEALADTWTTLKSRHGADHSGITTETIACCEQAWLRARSLAGADDVICICGSFFLVAELESLVRREVSAEVAEITGEK